MLQSRSLAFRLLVLGAVGALLLVVAGVAAATFGSPRAWLGLTPDHKDYVGPEPTAPCLPKPRELRTLETPAAAAGEWAIAPQLPFGRDEAASAYAGGRIYFIAGHRFFKGEAKTLQSVSEMVSFKPASAEFRSEPAVPIRVDHPMAVSHDGKVYVVGGFDNRRPVDTLFEFDPATREWTQLASMPTKRGAAAAGVIDGKLYVTGGAPPTFPKSFAEPYGALEIYDFTTDTWSQGAPIPTARHHIGGATLDGKFYVAGGREPDEPDFSLNAFERYDPATDKWEKLPPIPLGVGGVAAVATDSEVLVLGGADEIEKWITPTVWAFDPATNRWRRLPDMQEARHSLTATVGGGKVWAMGGAPCPGFGLSSTVESLPA